MPSNAEIKKRERNARQLRRSRKAGAGAAAMAIALALYTNRSAILTSIALGIVALLLLFSTLQMGWIADARPLIAKITRTAIAAVLVASAVTFYGWMVWPPKHRHELNAKERDLFKRPLKDYKKPELSIHLYCAPEDEVDCEYAAALIPLFGEAGWDVANRVDRITLARPAPGIVIALHGTVKPEDEPKLKWNEGEWTLVRPEEWAVRQAFVNIGIEPQSTSGGTVPEDQINVYVGHEREDESAPTDMTRMFENWKSITEKTTGVK